MKYHIVVGGSKGIGREFVKKLLKNKKNKILLISRSNIDIKSENIIHFKTDLSDKKNVKNTLKNIIKLNCKVNSLLFCQKYRPIKNNNKLKKELIINVESTKIIIETLIQNDNTLKSIVVIGSIASKFVATEQSINYHISKSALIGLVNYYAVSLAELGIRINMISPSTVIKDENREFYKNNTKLYNLYCAISPSNLIVNSSNVADLIQYLLSKKSKFITGQNIIIDGGMSLVWQEVVGRKFVNVNNIKITR